MNTESGSLNDLSIRDAKTNEFEECYQLLRKFYCYDLKNSTPKLMRYFEWSKNHKKVTKKIFDTYLSDDSSKIIVAINKSKVIGLGIAQIEHAEKGTRLSKIGDIHFILVDPSMRGKGISSKIKSELFKWFIKKGVFDIKLDVLISSKKNIGIYKKWGFRPYMLDMRASLKREKEKIRR